MALVKEETSAEFYCSLYDSDETAALIPSKRRKTSHDLSTGPTHNFNKHFSAHSIPPSKLTLDSSNKGFRLLSKMGWSESTGGLGKTRSGKLEPIRTVKNSNQVGLGGNKKTPKLRVTHKPSSNSSYFEEEEEEESETLKERKKHLESERREERKIRMSLRTDLSDADEALLNYFS